MDKQTILDVIRKELDRQYQASRANGLGYFNDDNPEDANIDGHVNLVELANAIAIAVEQFMAGRE